MDKAVKEPTAVQEPTARHMSAIEQLERDDASRKKFLKMVGGAGAASAFAIFLAACGKSDEKKTSTAPPPPAAGGNSEAQKMFGKGDAGILKYALTLEYLEADFYKQAAESGKLKGKALGLGKEFGEQEQAHVDALSKALKQMGESLPDKPKGKFPLDSQQKILTTAADVESLGASAYLGAAGLIKDKQILAVALSIHTVEARHASALAQTLGRPITPDGAFAKPTTMDEVLTKVKPFIAS